MARFCINVNGESLMDAKPNPFQVVSNPKPVPTGAVMVKDPVCHMDVYPPNAAGSFTYNGLEYHFCSNGCVAKFSADPERFLAPPAPARADMVKEPVGHMDVDPP